MQSLLPFRKMTAYYITIDLVKVLQYCIAFPAVVILLPILLKSYVNSWLSRNKLQGKVVLITGASSGLGEALANELFKKGCKLILAARRLDQLERVKVHLLSLDCDAETHVPEIIQLDVSQLGTLPVVAEEILKIYGRLDVLLNNAGISYRGRVDETSMDVHQRVMMVNYFGQICLTKALLPSMVAQKSGHIVMINSVQGKVGLPFRSAYAASKHALQAYSDSLRAEIAKSGILVTVANPGYIKTSISINALTATGSQYAKMDEATAKGYTPTEAANMIITAISDEQKEIVIAPVLHKIAIVSRLLFPEVYFYAMQRRAAKEK